jgi:hypothetical protein
MPLLGRISEALSSSGQKAQQLAEFDERTVELAARYGVPLLRYSLDANITSMAG